jgi:hypothetical protein
MPWWDFYKIFQNVFTDDPLAKKNNKSPTGAGIPQPGVGTNTDNSFGGRGAVRLRDTNEFVDLSTVTSRIHRYKEYDRLRTMPEIEMCMTVFADEACLAGETIVETPTYGAKSIKWLTENLANERFLVYCWDFGQEDYTLGWAYNPRLVKEEETVRIYMDDGSYVICTPDHRILLKNQKWVNAGNLKFNDELMPFYRLPARQDLTKLQKNQFPRIYTHHRGWLHERQIVDEWKTGKPSQEMEETNKFCRMIAQGVSMRQMYKLTGIYHDTIKAKIERAGFSTSELKWLGKKSDSRKVLSVHPHKKMAVYDLSVEKHENFCTNWGVVHNCQKDEEGKVFKVISKNQEVVDECNDLLFNKKLLNLDQKRTWQIAKDTFINGDWFGEILLDTENPKRGILGLQSLPADSMYRIETTKGKLVEFQQSQEGPDYQSLARVEVTKATEADLMQAFATRFAPEQIIHIRINDDRKTFYPYGVSLIEPARGPAHQLRLMEDAMVTYRLVRAPERRVFYIDVQSLPPYKAEAFIDRLKDTFKKKKMPNRSGLDGASQVEERWSAPAADEDFWIPTRPNSNTRVETLPGASNLGEVDDTLYFRNKLFMALNFPKNYFNNEDVQTTRIALSSQDVKFARMIERLQSHIEDAIWDLCHRHLTLLGYPEELFEDLEIKMTPPSDWRELTRAEVLNNRISAATSMKGSAIMSDFDILTKFMKYSEDEAKVMIARLKMQKMEELKLQIIAQNPQLLGVGMPGPGEQELGTEAGGPNPMLGPEGQQPPPPEEGSDPNAPPGMPNQPPPTNGGGTPPMVLPEPNEEEVKKYDLDIQDFAKEQDIEEIDQSE